MDRKNRIHRQTDEPIAAIEVDKAVCLPILTCDEVTAVFQFNPDRGMANVCERQEQQQYDYPDFLAHVILLTYFLSSSEVLARVPRSGW